MLGTSSMIAMNYVGGICPDGVRQTYPGLVNFYVEYLLTIAATFMIAWSCSR